MKTITTHHESYQPKQGFGARLLFYAFLLSIIGLSKAFAQVPIAPTATAADSLTCSSFNANWGVVSGATTYYLDVATDASFTSFLVGYNNLNTGNVSTYVVGGLTFNTVYYYRVRAENGNGTSLNSNVITYLAGGPPTVTATPQSQTICSNDSTIIFLSGSDPNTTFTWTVTQSALSGATAGSGSAISDVYNLTGSSSGVAIYMVTPISNGCNGSPLSVSVTVLDCQSSSGVSFSSPLNGATINNRCDLQFCITDSIGMSAFYSVSSDINGYNHIVNGYNTNQNGGGDTICLSYYDTYNPFQTITPGTQMFYLWKDQNLVDSISLTIVNPISTLKGELTFNYAPSTNGNYDFSVSGLNSAYNYTIYLQQNGSYIDSLNVSNNTSATLTHQFSYNASYEYLYLFVTSPCNGGGALDTIPTINITNSACSSFVDFTGSLYLNQGCASNTLNLYGQITSGGLSNIDSSQVLINWGDGSTQIIDVINSNSLDTIISQTHQYLSPGTYTAIITVNNANACYVDTLIQSITIGSSTCGNLLGTVYNDANNNCSQDIGEVGIANVLVYVTPFGYWAWTDNLGNYAFNSLPVGTYTIQIGSLSSGYSVTCSNSQAQAVTISSGVTTVNFAASCNGAFDAAITGISIWSALYPGQPEMILPHVGILNGGCNSTVVAGQVKIVLDACTQYTSPSIYSGAGAPDAVITAATGDTLVWNVADINNIGNFSYYDYAINILMCTTAQVGDSACITMIVEPLTGDADPTNNTYTRCFEIGVSYDPNNKEVQPTGVEAAGFIPADQPSLTYTLNFQNTGTAKAFNIYVMDTISANLDINSIEILSASHKLQVYTLPNRSVKFMFADIMLIDSTHDEPNSHGYVTFKIKVNQGLTPGTEIENTGHIYFDYNDPIVTNTTLNTIEFPSSVNAIGKSTVVKVFPNPAKESVTVVSNSNNTGTITITDLLGKTVKEVTTTNDKTVVNTADLQSGVYFIKLTQNNVSTTEKIMIAK